MAASSRNNPLVDTSTSAEANPAIALHPLVILTISDFVTRATLRNQKVPIVGAVIGQQDGKEITMEVAFECKTVVSGGQVLLDKAWFGTRLEQYRDVFKAPQLDLVGWFTLSPESGPSPHHIPLHHQIQSDYNLENAILLLFHMELVSQSSRSGGKLPLTLYEGVRSTEDSANAMDVDGGAANGLRFRELAYTVETGEAEMISLDFVARGGGNAAAVTGGATNPTTQPAKPAATSNLDKKGKGKAVVDGPIEMAAQPKNHLSTEDDEYITSLTAKINAIKMLQARLDLLTNYLKSLPPSYLTDPSLPVDATQPQTHQPNHQILRSIASLLARLPLLSPADLSSFARETNQIKSDVELVKLLASLTQMASNAKELGNKFVAAEPGRVAGQIGRGGGGMGRMGGFNSPGEEFDGKLGGGGGGLYDDGNGGGGGSRADSGMGFVS